MKVRDIMTKELSILKEDDSFVNAASLIVDKRISGIPIVNDKYECIGMISEKDLLKGLFPTYKELFEMNTDTHLYDLDLENLEHHAQEVKNLKIKDMMNSELIFVDPDLPIMEAASMMIIYKVRHLPVVEEGNKLIGIISQGDVFRAIIKNELSPSVSK